MKKIIMLLFLIYGALVYCGEGERFFPADIDVFVEIKTFGIIELLLKNSSINEDTLLIIDEPEVHLHPSWQVKFAELLVLISKNINVQILLSSHSPYFIEALQSYSEKYDYTDQVNFYFADNDDYLYSSIYNSSNLSEVYDSISEAYYELKSIKPLNKND